MQRILGVLAGEGPANQRIAELARGADLIIAADSGQDICRAHGVTPHIVVGDFDSLSDRIDGVRYIHDPDEDRSDCDKLLDAVAKCGMSDFVLVGFEGDRLDHMLAGLASIATSALSPRIGLAGGTGHILRAGHHDFPELGSGRTVSALPIGAAIVSMRGFRWPLEKATLNSAGFLSLSNVVEQASVIEVHDGLVLCVVSGEPVDWR